MDHEKVNYRALTPAQKLWVVREMGFREESPLEHDVDCVSRQGSGFICTCWPGITKFRAPASVRKYMGEDDESRQAFADKRTDYQDDGIGENPGSWFNHLEKTASRHNS